ncbi:MAG: sulfite exporter TauE/SafE family protein [Variovorax sp.]
MGPETYPTLASAIALGLAAMAIGFSVGATGIGGFLIIPAMVVLVDLPLQVAIGTALATGITNGALGTFLYGRRGSVDWRLALPLCVGGAAFGVAGGLLNRWLPLTAVAAILGCVMVLGSAFALRPTRGLAMPILASRPGGQFAMLTGIGALSGLIGGVTGAGGPVVSVPLLTILSYPATLTVGASQCLQLVASASGITPYASVGAVSLMTLVTIVPLQLLGGWFGVRAMHAMDVQRARKLVAGLGVVVGCGILGYLMFGKPSLLQ